MDHWYIILVGTDEHFYSYLTFDHSTLDATNYVSFLFPYYFPPLWWIGGWSWWALRDIPVEGRGGKRLAKLGGVW